MTGLPAQVIKMIGNFLTRATALQAIHLCGNEGVSLDTIEWLSKRIRAKDNYTMPTIFPLDKQTMAKPDSASPVKQPDAGGSSVLGLFGIGKKKAAEPLDPQKEWRELRAGLKL